MIFVDKATGSKGLVAPLQKLGLAVEPVHLQFGDLMWEGLGAGGHSVDVGVEYKKLGDCIQSLRNKRLQGHQVPGMTKAYEHRWLVVEGHWRHDESGRIVTYRGKKLGWRPVPGNMNAAELEKELLTLEVLTGLHVRYTNTTPDSLRFLHTLYRWWTDKALDRHTSHIAVYEPPTLVPIGQFRRTVCTLPGIGIKVSIAVERHFGTLRAAFNAGAHEWAMISTTDDRGRERRIGSKDADRIFKAIHERSRHVR